MKHLIIVIVLVVASLQGWGQRLSIYSELGATHENVTFTSTNKTAFTGNGYFVNIGSQLAIHKLLSIDAGLSTGQLPLQHELNADLQGTAYIGLSAFYKMFNVGARIHTCVQPLNNSAHKSSGMYDLHIGANYKRMMICFGYEIYNQNPYTQQFAASFTELNIKCSAYYLSIGYYLRKRT